MTVPTEVLIILGLVVAGGLAWLFRHGDVLAKTAAVITTAFMTVTVAQWAAGDRSLHTIEAHHGLKVIAMVGAGLLVVRYAAWTIPLAIVGGCVVLVGDLGVSMAEVVR